MEIAKEEQELGTGLNKKKTQGRRKIEIRKIEKRSSRQVTFSKRRAGLFKYVNDVCVLTGAQIGVLVKSPGNKIFAYGSPNIDAIIDRFHNKPTEPSPPERFWWEESVENMGFKELQEFVAALEELKKNVSQKISMKEEEGFQSGMGIPNFEKVVTMVDGWMDFSRQDRNFSGDSSSGFENYSGFQKIDDLLESVDVSSSGFDNVDVFYSGFQKIDAPLLESVGVSSSGVQNVVDSPCGFEDFDDSSSGFRNFDDFFSSDFESFVDSPCGFENFDDFRFDFGHVGSPLLLN